MSPPNDHDPVPRLDHDPVPRLDHDPVPRLDHDPVLRLDQVVKEFPGSPPVRAVDSVSLSIKPGELVAIVGASGSGKSTLLNLIGTLDRPTSGRVIVDGQPVDELSDAGLAGLRSSSLGFIFQSFHLLEGSAVVDNVAAGLFYRGVSRRERRRAALTALERVGLSHRVHHRPPQLSGGERQRVAVARAIVGGPAVVLADEPTGNLDSKTSTEIVQLFRRLNREGATIVVITHDRELAASFPRQVMMRDGRVLSDTVDGRFADGDRTSTIGANP